MDGNNLNIIHSTTKLDNVLTEQNVQKEEYVLIITRHPKRENYHKKLRAVTLHIIPEIGELENKQKPLKILRTIFISITH